MVGLSDIPCVGIAVNRISEATIEKLFRGLRYLFCYNNLVKVLNSEIGKLSIQEANMDEKARAEEDNGKKIKPHVLEWQNDVIEIQESTKTLAVKYENRLSFRCIQCLPIPNPVSRFRLGREAVQKAKSITEFTDFGEKFLASEIASFPPVENVPISDNAFQIFQSREGAYGKLWKQLVTEGSSLILGIYGIPGVGKTRMMEQIWTEAIEKGIFDKVTRAVPGNENLNDNQVIINIQNQIAGYLGCHFESQDNVERRAFQLKNSLINGGKILVILDDVWSEIPLNKFGIPFVDGSSSKGCKILFTSREEDVCLRNNCKHPVRITAPTVDEAWNLFRNTVGTSQIDSLQDQSLAWRVCNKCANLPPLIHAVGEALKFNHHDSLESALYQFANCDIRDIQGIDPKVYAYLRPVENLPKTVTAFQNFNSRKDAYGKLWEALVTEGSSLILGIYGMPGVGKTRMMEQIWKEAIEKKIFDKVTRAVVGGENLDDKELQNQIAGYLDCHFESQDDVERRASQLKSTLMNGGKILVILDDVWSEIPLDKIGFTFGDGSSFKGCKILLTSRTKDVCLKNKCEYPVMITTLEDDEAFTLFRNTVGTLQIDSLQDKSLARDVCKKCGGLPLVIDAVGKALKFMVDDAWVDALNQLKNRGIKRIAGLDPQVYVCLKWSFDRLVDEDAKTCLLLCSLFPEDANIAITVLFQLATGSQLIDMCGRSRVRTMVHILKSASLLLAGADDEHFKLHDIIRDVARSIAINDPKYEFLFVKCRSQLLDDDCGTRKLLHLDLERNDVHFPGDQVCPDLQTLWLQCSRNIQKFSGGFFSMFVNLKFLFLRRMIFSSQQHFSLQPLGKLRTIILDGCDITGIGETDVSFFPENVQTLCIWDCVLPTSLDLPNLKYLRKLEILRPLPEVIMVPNAISRLSSLEELHIPNGFSIFNDNRSARILDEISKLTCLRSLQITLSNKESFQDIYTFCNVLEFNIHVGWSTSDRPSRASLTRLIELCEYPFEDAESLVERAEEVILVDSHVKVSSICDGNRKAFADLRYLYIKDCNTMEHLARISQDKIEYSRQPRTSFSKLIVLEIRDCSEIKYLFCNSVAKCLVQLEELYIERCPLMEVIVMNEGISDGDIINFSKLKALTLSDLPRLTSFYREKKDVNSSSTSIMGNSDISSVQFQPLFDGKVAFPSLEELVIDNLGDLSDIWGNQYDNDNVSFCQMKSLEIRRCNKLEIVFQHGMLHRLRNLEDLGIWHCDSLRKVFLPSTARDLMHLKEMIVSNCEMMREVIGAGDQEISDGIAFPKLTLLKLTKLPSLTSFWCYQSEEANTYKVVFPNLVEFIVFECMEIKLEALELGRDDSTCQLRLYNLEILSLEHTWWHELNTLRFQRLKVLGVSKSDCSTLFTFSAFSCLQQLENLRISECPLLEEIVEDDHEPSGMDNKTITLFQLKSVILTDLPNLKSFIQGVNYECHMPALETMVVDNCGLSTLFRCSVFRNLQHLESLQVSNCRLLQGIVENGRGAETFDHIITLFRIQKITVKNLPNLKSFIHSANYEFHMPALKRIKVENCGLSTLFTCSVFRNLQQLETLVVLDCRLLEGIVGGDETSDKIITLFRLQTITLMDLPNFKSFSSTTSYAFNLPNFKYIQLSRCSHVESFSYTGEITDLNDYIKPKSRNLRFK